MELTGLLEQVVAAAKGSGELLRNARQFETFVKEGHGNFVTSVDLASQAYLQERLAPLLPQAHFMAEEQDAIVLKPGYNWIVDPLDGTANYLHGYRHSAVSIGLVQDDVGVLGVVYDPFADELYTAVRGEGAFLNETAIHVSDLPLDRGLLLFGTAPYDLRLAERSFRAAYQLFRTASDVRRSGSAALDLCFVAAGRCEGFFEMVLSPWDYAAASVIVTEAGGVVGAIPPEEWGFRRPIGICAANPVCHGAILEAVEAACRESN